jgi:hypothetical protein
MIPRSQRLFTRRNCRLPIQYRTTENTAYCDSVMYNCSRTGIYFEACDRVVPDETLHIAIPTYSHALEGIEKYPYYVAKAVWCQQIPDDANPRYGCGSVLLKRSRYAGGSKLESICHTCDLCQKMIPCVNLSKTDDFIYLCVSCANHLERIPDGSTKRSIMRFLSGNVV